MDFARPLRARSLDDERSPFEKNRRDALERGTDRRAPGEPNFALRQRRATQQIGERSRQRVSKGLQGIDLIIAPCA